MRNALAPTLCLHSLNEALLALENAASLEAPPCTAEALRLHREGTAQHRGGKAPAP